MSKVSPIRSSAARRPLPRIIIASGGNVRTIVFRPWLAGSLAILGFGFFALYLAATGYLVFRDDLLTASIARQARIQHAYEDRIAVLRADIDRLTSRQLLNQQAFDDKLEKLLGRQAALDARQDSIAGLSQAFRRAGLAPLADAVPTPVPNPAAPEAIGGPLTTGSIAPLLAGQRASLALGMLRPSRDAEAAAAPPDLKLAEAEDSLENLAERQVAFVGQVAEKIGERADRITAILKKIGHAPPAREDGVGGPFVPLEADADPETFRSNVALVAAEVDRYAAAREIASRLPLAKPVANAVITSRYGSRLDPFLKRPALHTGIDFRATTGYPVKSTAAGKVITAEYSGGYGKMVEIDHGNGVTTRFGHLSRILVKPGQEIPKGFVVGRAGSTGRSTGPHIHYEIRIDGDPIDPIRYIRAGSEIGSLL
jgi:murein DD-endopeptidase MepM/ murein hydrolase activator NlpD